VGSIPEEVVGFFNLLNPSIRTVTLGSTQPLTNYYYYYYYYLVIILTADGFLPGGSGTTMSHNTQITHMTR
jgi:hypothetical protein